MPLEYGICSFIKVVMFSINHRFRFEDLLAHLFHFNELVLTKSHYYRNCENKIVCFQYVKNGTYRFSQCSAIKYK